jgi:phosphatidylcholine synthase
VISSRRADGHGFVEPQPATRREALMVACAWGVHLYTALGAVLGLLSLYYAGRDDFRGSFIALGLATVIDSSDGPLARALEVKRRVPNFDGALLDNVVDYLTYVVAPVFVMIRAHLLAPNRAGLAMASAVMLASAYGFCRIDSKGEYFRGFPSYWNLVAFYLFCLRLPLRVNMTIVGLLAILVLVPIRFIYPNRTAPLRILTLVLGTLWALVTLAMLPGLPAWNPLLLYASLSFIVYYLITSLALHLLTRHEYQAGAAGLR